MQNHHLTSISTSPQFFARQIFYSAGPIWGKLYNYRVSFAYASITVSVNELLMSASSLLRVLNKNLLTVAPR